MYTAKKAEGLLGFFTDQVRIFGPTGAHLFNVANAADATTALLHLNAVNPGGYLPGSINAKMDTLIHTQLDGMIARAKQ